MLNAYLEQDVMDGLETWTPEEGTPQGAVISPLLANIYLNPLDHLMGNKGFEMVRYADDFVILCKSKEKAEEALAIVAQWTREAGLTLHPVKTRIVDENTDSFEFLGYQFKNGKHFPRAKSLKKLKDNIREKTLRRNGKSIEEIVKSLNSTLQGWYGYFKHSYKTVHPSVDGWIRRRLRSILLKRTTKRSRWRFTHDDHRRWPNAFFHALGLFSLELAFVAECQSRKRN
jgi:RNA-directed DNA polymerase